MTPPRGGTAGTTAWASRLGVPLDRNTGALMLGSPMLEGLTSTSPGGGKSSVKH